MKLKTLKDFELEIDGQGEVIDWIKKEAIKWYNEFQSKNWEDVDGHADMGGEVGSWIKHFFNLTEEDLK